MMLSKAGLDLTLEEQVRGREASKGWDNEFTLSCKQVAISGD